MSRPHPLTPDQQLQQQLRLPQQQPESPKQKKLPQQLVTTRLVL